MVSVVIRWCMKNTFLTVLAIPASEPDRARARAPRCVRGRCIDALPRVVWCRPTEGARGDGQF